MCLDIYLCMSLDGSVDLENWEFYSKIMMSILNGFRFPSSLAWFSTKDRAWTKDLHIGGLFGKRLEIKLGHIIEVPVRVNRERKSLHKGIPVDCSLEVAFEICSHVDLLRSKQNISQIVHKRFPRKSNLSHLFFFFFFFESFPEWVSK